MMKIETEHTPVQTATHALIDYSFQRVDREEGFIVLVQETSEYDFLQVDFEPGCPLELEYQEATEKKLYRCAREVSLEEVRKLFHDYLDQKPNWKTAFPWEEVKASPSFFESTPVKILFIAIMIIAAILGAWKFWSQCLGMLLD